MVLLVNMHFIKGTLIIFPIMLSPLVPIENDVIPMVLLVKLFSHVVWLGTRQFRWSIGTNRTIGTNRKLCHSNGSTGEILFSCGLRARYKSMPMVHWYQSYHWYQ